LDEKPIQTPMYLTPDQFKELNRLAELTRIQRSVLVREAVDDLLKKYSKLLKGGNKK
jgi:predicted transcriptional regulator